jgi:hydroxylamine dehydrogenase
MPRTENLIKIVFALIVVFILFSGVAGSYYVDPKTFGSPAGDVCVLCHREATPGIYNQWNESVMGQAGVNCYDCHKAEKDDIDAFEHKDLISIVVTPKDCSRCHEKEYKEYSFSHHADAVKTLDSFDNFFGRAVWGSGLDRTGCIPCHGSILKVKKEGRLDSTTWPNTGIGRINPDKSKGSCTACHTRHIFSREQARRPETCGRCHRGPEFPQFEVYSNSKHGVMYSAFRDKMSMDRSRWRVGVDYFQAPTCATCHMSAVPPQMVVKDADQRLEAALKSVLSGGGKEFEALLPPPTTKNIHYGATHDVGTRLSWTLRYSVSKKQKDWTDKRQLMQSVCFQCHSENFVKQFYTQFDSLVELYNKKFAVPATSMRKELMKQRKLTKENYDEPLDRIYWKLVNNEGRRARFGTAMVGPLYAWRKGMQEVAERYYMEFVPEVRNILGRKANKFLRKHGYIEPGAEKKHK